ncbi:MAG: extracellular solute-binding protein [Candidatus Bathyarchaeota archaeon]|nr:extracellular solute-binding protein [Candidatus Bathyarchaeota archaeon]
MNVKIVASILVVAIIVGGAYVYVTYLSAPPPTPGEIQLSALAISPSREVVEGKSVTISVNSTNTGETSETATITLKLNNVVEASEDVTLDAGESKTTSWTLSKSEGTYSVSIGALSDSFAVVSGITLTIITRHDTTIWTLFEPAFLATSYAQDNNVIDLRWMGPDPGLWTETIDATDVDVAWGGGPTLFDTLIDNDLLATLEEGSYALQMANEINDTLAGSSMKRLDEQDRVLWIAAAISSFGFTINNDFLADAQLPVPNKWEDLANETYGKLLPLPSISMGNAPGTTSNTRIYEIILQAFDWDEGWRILTRMAGNAGIYGGSVETQSAVEQGEVGVGMSIDFYGYTSQIDFPSTQYVLPEGQSIINGDPIALVAKSKHKDAAQDFIGWILSPEGQSIWLDERINRMPLRSDAFHTKKGQERSDLYALFNQTINNIGIPFSDELAISYEQSLMYYFEAVLKNEHEALAGSQGAWTELVKAKEEQRITQQQFNDLILTLGTPISWLNSTDAQTYQFTQEYAISINEKIYRDSLFRSQMQGIWGQAARAHYQNIYDSIPKS